MKISDLIGRRNRGAAGDKFGQVVAEGVEQVKLDAILEPYAERLAGILAGGNNFESERAAVDIGLAAWQLGGLTCMNRLHRMALRNSQEGNGFMDYISYWWDGIGTWRIY